MTEAEILEAAVQAQQAGLAIFSVLLSVVSGYIGALYFFLDTAPWALRLTAFAVLTFAIITLGALADNLQYLGEGMHVAWLQLPRKATGMDSLGPPLLVQSLFLDGRQLASLVAWVFGSLLYLALAYMTFIHSWRTGASAQGERNASHV
jgi:hypothetical protein